MSRGLRPLTLPGLQGATRPQHAIPHNLQSHSIHKAAKSANPATDLPTLNHGCQSCEERARKYTDTVWKIVLVCLSSDVEDPTTSLKNLGNQTYASRYRNQRFPGPPSKSCKSTSPETALGGQAQRLHRNMARRCVRVRACVR